MAKNTKERILETALELFSQNGYSGTSIKDIADKLGIVKSALYRHFESKDEIWFAVQKMMISYYNEHFGSVDKLQHLPDTLDELYEMTMRLLSFTVNDEKVIRMRKIMYTEQFRDESIRKLATEYFLFDTEAIFTKVFEHMMDKGSLKKTDPTTLAFAYTSPVTVLVHLCDREPDRKEWAMEKAETFLRHFMKEYGTEK